MATLPDTRLGKIEFFEQRIAPWTTNVTAIGLEGTQVVNLDALTTAARDAYEAAQAARNASKAATQEFYDAVAAMVGGDDAGSDMIEQIKNHAQSTGNPNVYVLAQIPAPAAPSPAPAPGRPSNFEVSLVPINGALTLRWKCANPAGTSGTMYKVERRIGASGSYVTLDTVGEKSFTDESLPTSAASAEGGVTYQITAMRSTIKGSPAGLTINFGAPGSSGMTATSTSGPVKLAA